MTNENIANPILSGNTDRNSQSTTLLIRKLPRNTTNEAVRTMLLFAKDLLETELVPNEHQEDKGFVTATARFSTATGASEAQTMLNGKPNTAGQAIMIVEIATKSSATAGRRNTVDAASHRGVSQPIASPPSQIGRSSRFNDTFQSMEKMSPPPIGSPPDVLHPDMKGHMHSMFAPQTSNQLKERARISGKSVIGAEGADEDTGELLKDPRAYLNGDSPVFASTGRQPPNSRFLPVAMGALSLNTSLGTTSPSGFASPRSAVHNNTPNSAFPSAAHPYTGGNHYLRHNYPPVNPADQNPPCNTLYVGNLPMDTSEDELKAMFSKQRGYKRLCFRTKQNGPMCFVEFEDVSFATKALNELYGAQLHNSVKGGIRLSFSKNPLGVRSGQPGSANPSTPLSPGPGVMNPMSPLSPGGFLSANGPPPGLSAPPGLASNGSLLTSPLQGGHFLHQPFPLGMSPVPGSRNLSTSNESNTPHGNSMYPDYMMGR